MYTFDLEPGMSVYPYVDREQLEKDLMVYNTFKSAVYAEHGLIPDVEYIDPWADYQCEGYNLEPEMYPCDGTWSEDGVWTASPAVVWINHNTTGSEKKTKASKIPSNAHGHDHSGTLSPSPAVVYTQQELKHFVEQQHDGGERFPCPFDCGEDFGTSADAARHGCASCDLRETQWGINCPVCLVPISRSDAVSRHLQNIHHIKREDANRLVADYITLTSKSA